ncbi:uncharacterized protein PADG_07981 [Paracoccidioides brasiliensis Pb18]|uniref:F-box domain-containing protein n=1 Tax=Paracoccidioides brasiliensis (strain Pb18) TaxID=502780 RepID=C1GKX4_PARBD|nr:uncharacterized protein PADG_07981 [Paracoccidioides brasiliensis Pb18]EEH43161.1 hypothetical protein PADG_07981 [Paracoccidioides brasiliensis Pb18]
MSLEGLPNELILQVADLLDPTDINALAQTNKRFHRLLNPYLYRQDVLSAEHLALNFALRPDPATIHWKKQSPDDDLYEFYHPTSSINSFTLSNNPDLLTRNATIRLSVENGEDLKSKWASDNFLFDIVCASQECNFWLMMKHGADVHAKSPDNRTLLHEAVKGSRTKILRYLIKEGLDVNARDSLGTTPLCLAAEHLNDRAIRLLSDNGADVDARDGTGWTALHTLAYIPAPSPSGYYRSLQALLYYNPDMDARTPRTGCNALHLAVSHRGNSKLINLLLGMGMDIESRCNGGSTPLHFAVTVGNVKAVQHLLDNGAKITTKDNQGRSVLQTAIENQDSRMTKCLLDEGADASTVVKGGTPFLRHLLREKLLWTAVNYLWRPEGDTRVGADESEWDVMESGIDPGPDGMPESS